MKKTLKAIYQFLPLLSLLKLWRKMGTPSFYKYLSIQGSFKTQLPDGGSVHFNSRHDLYIEKELFWHGVKSEFETYTLKIWMDLSSQSNVVFDIGANTGVFALLAFGSKARSIHAFEPVDYNFSILEKNVKLNQPCDITINKKALSNQKGEGIMFVKKNEINYINSLEGNRYNNEGEIAENFELITLAEYIEKNAIRTIDLMKIDVEGHEFQVLEGFGKYLNEFKPDIIIEILNDEFGKELEKIFTPIKEYNYYRINDLKQKLEKKENLHTIERVNFLITTKSYD